MQAPVIVLNTQTKRESGREVQISNITAAKVISDIIRTCLGPRSMLKMLLTPMGSLVITNDGNAILREINVNHPAAKSMIELSKTQDEEVGDGTTSVIILAGELLTITAPWLERRIHPTVIISGFFHALDDSLKIMRKYAIDIDTNDRKKMLEIIQSCIGTKFIAKWNDLMCSIALDAVQTVAIDQQDKKEIDIKRYVRVERIPGGEISDSRIIKGCILNKDVTHAKMRRRIENPRVILIDTDIDYKKGENETNIEISNEEDFEKILKIEEEQVKKMCYDIIKFKPDLVITEKGLSDIAQHYFVKHNITALRRLRKTDALRIAKATGATIVSRTEELKESDVGTKCGLYEVEKIGDEYFSFLSDCRDSKACTILLRGAGNDILKEVERNLEDALHVTRNVLLEPKLLPGGGATEMFVSVALSEYSKSIVGLSKEAYKAVSIALEVIPRTLAQNCGSDPVRLITSLRSKHATEPEKNFSWGIDGEKGTLVDMKDLGIWEPFTVKAQTMKTFIEASAMLLRVDDVVSGKKTEKPKMPDVLPEEQHGF